VSAVDALARVAEAVLPRVPPAWQRPLAEVAGSVAYLAAPRARAAVRSNLAVIAPEHPPRVRQVFVNSVIQYLEIFHIARLDRRRFLATVRMEGWENFTCAHALGKGVIFGSAHLGPVALVGQILMERGFELTLPVERTTSEFMRAVNRARSAQGLRLVPIDSAFGIHRVLRRGGVLGFLADRAITGVGERVEFFGRQTLLPSAHVALAHRTGAALVPAFTWRQNGLLFAHLLEPLDIPRTGDREADVREGVRRFAALLERYVRAHPEQWNVFEPVWGAA
jgi:lauroyl/myristoyl acyltransferase